MAKSKELSKGFRFRYIIDREFQFKFLLQFALLFASGVVVTLLYLYFLSTAKYKDGALFRLRQDPTVVYFQVFDEDSNKPQENVKYVERKVYLPNTDSKINIFSIQLEGVLVLSALYLSLIAIFSIIRSHRMAGPIYSIKKALESIKSGEEKIEIKIRKGDEFQDLVDSLNEVLRKKFESK